MFENLSVFQMARALAQHAQTRQGLIAGNIANANTPGYQARDLTPFAETYRQQASGAAMQATRSTHFTSSGSLPSNARVIVGGASPDGNGVSLEQQMAQATDVQRHHAQAMAIYRSSLTVLRGVLRG